MSSSRYFDHCSAFPLDLSTAALPTISLKKLIEDESDESKILYEACRKHGFFYLDLQGVEKGEVLLRDAKAMFDLINTIQDLGREVLDQYAFDPPRTLLGYKSTGKQKTDDGRLDAMEMYNLGQDDMVGNSAPHKNPQAIDQRRPECAEFVRHAHGVVTTVMGQLDKALDLPSGTLAGLSRLDRSSETSLRLLWSRPEAETDRRVTLGGHTDIGMITLLFHIAGGLQILPAGSENVTSNWRYIKPEPGCVLVNLGDTMVEWTGGLLRSALHRVMTAPGEQAKTTRRSLAYLVRPDRSQTMRRLRSSLIPPLGDGEVDNTRPVTEWAGERSLQILRGELKPQTRGGGPVDALV